MKKFVRTLRENFIFLLMVLPGAAWLILFFYIPVFGNIVAFKDYHITGEGFIDSVMKSKWAVSYTHLDVYKRQKMSSLPLNFLKCTGKGRMVAVYSAFYLLTGTVMGMKFQWIKMKLWLSGNKNWQTFVTMPQPTNG